MRGQQCCKGCIKENILKIFQLLICGALVLSAGGEFYSILYCPFTALLGRINIEESEKKTKIKSIIQ